MIFTIIVNWNHSGFKATQAMVSFKTFDFNPYNINYHS